MKTLLSLLVSLLLSAGLYAQSFDDYRAAAESGDPVAVSNAGVCFLHGWGVEQNHAEALKCFRQAAGHDVPAAYYNLGLCYEKGGGCRRISRRPLPVTAGLRSRAIPTPNELWAIVIFRARV